MKMNLSLKAGLLAALLFVAPSAFAHGISTIKPFGDGDPFPVACANFSGEWRSDKAQVYQVAQRDCSWIQIHKYGPSLDLQMTIVPDNVQRSISAQDFTGTVRHRWNSRTFGATVETHRTMEFSDRSVTEYVSLEEVNENLILENTYRVTDMKDGSAPQNEYAQQVFRRSVMVKPTGLPGSSW